MKAFTMRALIAVTIAGTLSSVAWADNEGQGRKCDSTTLKGSYVFSASGFNIVAGVAQPKTIVELIDFHGNGALTVSGGTLSNNGSIIPIAPNGAGNYTVDPDCTGTVSFIPAPSFNLVVEVDGKSGWMIQTGPTPSVFQGTLTRRK
jgi:hypothetical protein